jgi:hypothetical protein
MPKARQQQSELRTSVVPIEIVKYLNLQGLREQAQKHWGIRNLQPFFPCLETLFKIEEFRIPFHYGLRMRRMVQTIASPDTIFFNSTETTIHRKTTMLLSPWKWMRGEFGSSGLPVSAETSNEIREKLQSKHNAAYVGALISCALSDSGCNHFPIVFGTFVGLCETFVLNISDDYEELCESRWFSQNIGHFFDLRIKESLQHRSSQQKELTIENDDSLMIEATVLEPIDMPRGPIQPAAWQNDEDSQEEDVSVSDSTTTDDVFDIESCGTSDAPIGVEDDEEEPFAHALFKDVQVQTTLLEKCEGTLYRLLKEEKRSEVRLACLTQVVFALAYAQRNYGFVHNDLHVNNVMYVRTSSQFLYYTHAGSFYKVPTYGYLMKIIDFDRATFSLRLPGMRESKFFMSDQFHPNEEAGGQYNTDPFYVSKYPEIRPNASFDLVRLATSMFWDCFPEGPFCSEYASDPLFKVLMQWMSLPGGKSIMFRNISKKDAHEPYHGFDLYKAIARYCKDTAVPRKQTELFSLFRTDRVPMGDSALFIDV